MELQLGVITNINEKYSWRVVREMDTLEEFPLPKDRLMEINLKAAVAEMLMNEAFGQIIDPHTGVNLVQSVVYSRR